MTIKGTHLNTRTHENPVNLFDEFTAYYDLLDGAIELKFSASPVLTELLYISQGARQLTLQIPPNHHAAKALLNCIPSADSVEAIITLIDNGFKRLKR